MRTVGIIAEYNPFHTGHEYHIRRAKELSGADYAVVVMSPDFVQRGEPAVFDKYTRARMALSCGADLVLELPVCYACASAEFFSEGAVALLDRLGTVDTLCFGAESDNSPLFLQIADILLREPEEFTVCLLENLKKGSTYPAARSLALAKAFRGPKSARHEVAAFVSSPNNILGIEYCKALLRLKSPVCALPILRRGNGYNSKALDGTFCSATALRECLTESGCLDAAMKYIPPGCRPLLSGACATAVSSQDFLPILIQKLLTRPSFEDILDIGPELSDRMCSLRFQCAGKSFREITALLKTKQVTEARIRRALLHLILGFKTETIRSFRQNGIVFYARILGLRKEASPLLHAIKQNSRIPLISKNVRASGLLSDTAQEMWNQDLAASHLYRGILSLCHHTAFQSEYEKSPVVIP